MAKVIGFVNQKGGVGKSVIADELAFEFDRLGVAYNLYDLDGQGGLIHQEQEPKGAKYTILDTAGYIDDAFKQTVKDADILIVPTRASIKEMQPLENTLEYIKSNKKKNAVVIIVLNGWNRYTSYTQFEEWLKDEYPEFNKIITLPQSEPLTQAGAFGQSVVEFKPRNKAAEQLKKLWAIVEYELGMKL